jgi:hypothetical protein
MVCNARMQPRAGACDSRQQPASAGSLAHPALPGTAARERGARLGRQAVARPGLQVRQALRIRRRARGPAAGRRGAAALGFPPARQAGAVMKAAGRPSQESGRRHVISDVTLRTQLPAPLAGLACLAPCGLLFQRRCSAGESGWLSSPDQAVWAWWSYRTRAHAGCRSPNIQPQVPPAAGRCRARGAHLFAERATGLAGRSSSSLSSAQTCQLRQLDQAGGAGMGSAGSQGSGGLGSLPCKCAAQRRCSYEKLPCGGRAV